MLFWLTQKAAELFGTDFNPEIVETHHKMKKDAPSGTAKTLAEILKACEKAKYRLNQFARVMLLASIL